MLSYSKKVLFNFLLDNYIIIISNSPLNNVLPLRLLTILPVQVHYGYATWHPVTGTTLAELTVWRMLAEIANI